MKKDPIILLGVINTKLRDFYPSLTALCDDLNVAEEEISASLAAVGYKYSPEKNQFI